MYSSNNNDKNKKKAKNQNAQVPREMKVRIKARLLKG